MQERIPLPGYHWFRTFKDPALRVGIYSGTAMSLVLLVWVIVANRIPTLETFALQRNLAAAVALAFIAALPVIRFYRSPWQMVQSGFLAWTLLIATFSLLTLKFDKLDAEYGAFHLFVLGMLTYLILATLSWIGTIIRRAWIAHSSDRALKSKA